MTNASDLADDIAKAIQEVQEREEKVEEGLKPIAPKLNKLPFPSPAEVRFHLTQWIVGAFIVYSAAVGIFIMWSEEKEKFTILLEILKTLFLPLVTLVIGHYFGSKSE
jgi:hypothetical protein